MSDQRYPIWGRLGVGAEVWVELTQEERGKGSAVLTRRTFQTVMNVLRHCDEKHYGSDPMAATHAAIRALPLKETLHDMQLLSDQADNADGDPILYQTALVSLGLVARHFLRECAPALARLLGDPVDHNGQKKRRL